MALKKITPSGVLLILTGLILLTSCRNKMTGKSEEILARTPVTITRPVLKNMQETLEFPAITVYLVKNVVRSSITGTIEDVAVRQGDRIKKGALLLIIKSREAVALQNTERTDSALRFKGTISVYSPNAGIISIIARQRGDFVQEGDDLVEVSDPGSIVFLLEAPYEMTAYIEKNRICSLTLPDNTILKGQIGDRLAEMDARNQTVRYIVNTKAKEPLPENLIASAIITKSVKKEAVVIPRQALLGNETLNDFWVMKVINDSTAVKVRVTRGIETDSEVEIAGPVLLPTDRVVLTGNYGLPDTALIIIEK